MTEIWKPIVGHPGYEVSDLGRVRSIDRIIERAATKRTKAYAWPLKGQLLAPNVTGSRHQHMAVSLGARKKHKVHHLVLEAFVGPRPAGGVGRHGAKGSLCNSLDNLCWGTQSDNVRDAVAAGTFMSEKRKAHLKTLIGRRWL